ncbi:hypothetical protein MSAN_01529700 [Mycena sanguinolenta]|uniref:Uncharacterized protein n=1 Tax=Mycena sanguinolenta TaxID=230812 RepID=A0A8H6Y7R3_9AGAR|nr:hypothetical protein MSAN_01529700 [Mycena sanguinolenta]
MSSSPSIDYAAAFGMHSVAAAAIFAVLFFPLSCWFVRQSIKNTTYVYIILTLFCAMRVTAYLIRAIMANSISEGSILSLFIADQILFGVGFFALLYSAYTLVIDRDVIAGGEPGTLFSLNLLRNPHLFRMALTACVVLGIIGTVNSTSSNPSDVSTGLTLRKASTVAFFVLTVVQVAQTIWFFPDTRSKSNLSRRSWGDQHGRYLLLIISILMLVREGFLTATINNSTKQNDERLWYPLVALPEFGAVICYAVSGLVPTRKALKEAQEGPSAYTMRGSSMRPVV